LQALRKTICAAEHDVLYLNSFFSPSFTIKPLLLRRLGLVPKVPVILAPRGELSAGALTLKAPKKRLYLILAKAFGLYRGLIWQASSKYEAENIRCWLGDQVPVVTAPNLPAPSHGAEKQLHRREKVGGRLKVVFLSRISRMKNLRGALSMLKELKGEVEFNIYGPLEDVGYWKECQKVIRLLPQHIQVQYRGGIAHDEVADVLADYDLFFLPTLGENFGHVISEALLAGCPVLISDCTPWRSLQEKGVGWDLPLEQPERFIETLQDCIEMGAQEHDLLSRRARAFALEQAQDPALLDRYRRLFESVLCWGWQKRG